MKDTLYESIQAICHTVPSTDRNSMFPFNVLESAKPLGHIIAYIAQWLQSRLQHNVDSKFHFICAINNDDLLTLRSGTKPNLRHLSEGRIFIVSTSRGDRYQTSWCIVCTALFNSNTLKLQVFHWQL